MVVVAAARLLSEALGATRPVSTARPLGPGAGARPRPRPRPNSLLRSARASHLRPTHTSPYGVVPLGTQLDQGNPPPPAFLSENGLQYSRQGVLPTVSGLCTLDRKASLVSYGLIRVYPLLHEKTSIGSPLPCGGCQGSDTSLSDQGAGWMNLPNSNPCRLWPKASCFPLSRGAKSSNLPSKFRTLFLGTLKKSAQRWICL